MTVLVGSSIVGVVAYAAATAVAIATAATAAIIRRCRHESAIGEDANLRWTQDTRATTLPNRHMSSALLWLLSLVAP